MENHQIMACRCSTGTVLKPISNPSCQCFHLYQPGNLGFDKLNTHGFCILQNCSPLSKCPDIHVIIVMSARKEPDNSMACLMAYMQQTLELIGNLTLIP